MDTTQMTVEVLAEAGVMIAAGDDRLVTGAHELVIENAEQATAASDLAKLLAGGHKTLEDRRKAMVKPFNETVKAINDLFRQPVAALKAAKDAAAGKALAWQLEQDRQAREVEAAARLAAEEALVERATEMEAAGQGDTANAVIDLAARAAERIKVKPSRVDGDFGQVGGRTKVGFELIDIRAVPVGYLQLDERAILAELRAGRNVPGIRRTETTVAVVR